MRNLLRLMVPLFGLVPLGVHAEGSRQLTPNTNPGVALTDPANTRSGFLEHDANFTDDGVNGLSSTSRAFLKPSGFTSNNRFTYNDNQRMYVLLKPGETVYYGVHRTPHALNLNPTAGGVNQSNLIITALHSADGLGTGTIGKVSKIYRDSSATNTNNPGRQSTFLTTLTGGVAQAGVIATAEQNQAGPRVNGQPANGYVPLFYKNTTSAIQYVWFEFVQQGETVAGFNDNRRFSTYDFWDFTVVNDATGAIKPGRLFSKQWAFSAGSTTGRFSSAFNMYPLIPSPRASEANRYYVKKFELAGIAPQNFFRFVSNSTGANPAQVTPNTFLSTTKSQTSEVDYPEYLNFVNDPDPEIWPSAADPDLQVISTASYCKDGRGVMVFFLRSALGGTINIDIDLNNIPGYQANTVDRRITTTISVGNSRVEWDGLNGANPGVPVSSGTPLTLTFRNSISPIAPVNFPVWDAENNLDGFRIQNVRPGSQGFDVLYWDDSNLDATEFPNTTANQRTQLTGVPSITGVHTWGGTAAPTLNAGDLVLVNTYTYGNTEQQSRTFTFNYVCDPDGDGVNDNLDIDQDNDGITNTAESNGVDPTFVTLNGVPRYLDPYEANFVDRNQDGVNDVYDFDFDGIPNFLDIDSDGDGIPDTIEANGGVTPITPAGTVGYDANLGRYPSTGVGANGMPNAAETGTENGITRLPLTNTDNVGQPDYLDIDSDNDGIVDNIEAQPTTGYRAPSGIDTDRDGLDNRYDLSPGTGQPLGAAVPLTNTDFTTPATPANNDNLPDYRDLNSENDGRTDAVEGWDTNNDGIAERVFSGVDVDGDGLDDAYDNDIVSFNPTNGQTPTSFPNADGGTTERDWREALTTPQVVTTLTIRGSIFEDVNYGGGAGRNYADANAAATASGFAGAAIGRPGVTVELYDANGNYVASTVTIANGTYTFALTNRAAGSYSVRVVSSTGFTSVRAGTTTGLLPVQTFANGATNKVGGEIPTKLDASANTTGLTLSTIINGTTTTAQSLTTINVPAGTTSTVANIDFGFNFNVISNTNSAGQGSLAQFILNSNALPNANLDQTGIGRPGVETSIFMIGDSRTSGTPPAGLRSGVDGGTDPITKVATIRLTALTGALPNITSADTNLDGSRQTVVTGSTPTSSSGTSTDPEVVIDFSGLKGLEVTGARTRIASIGVTNALGDNGFAQGAAVYLNGAPNSIVTDITATSNNTGGIRLNGANGAIIANNVLVGSTTQNSSADGIQITGNTSNTTITGNTIADNRGNGIEFVSGMNNTNNISGNIIRNNGAAGITIAVGNNNLFSQNIITGNNGDGIEAASATSGNRFTQNVTSGNGGIGIDLLNTAPNSNGVSRNVDTGTGANGRVNFPVFTQASISGGVLKVTGMAPAGSTIEIFVADNDGTRFGEGRTFLTSVVEGSAADGDNKVGSYSGVDQVTGLDYGTVTNESRFFFRIPLTPAQLSLLQIGGAQITSTATILSATTTTVNGVQVGNTSEFSGNLPLSTAPLPVELTKFEAAAQTNNAVLTWATASEKNNDHFTVERSLNGTTFVSVGTVKGNGTTMTAHQYSFVDAGASRFGQSLYYRLRQVDTDGTESFSPVRTVAFAPQAVQLTLYPNPTTITAATTLDLSALPAGTYSVTLTDMTGRTVATQSVQGGLQEKLQVSKLPAGTYLVQVRGNKMILTQRLVKQN